MFVQEGENDAPCFARLGSTGEGSVDVLQEDNTPFGCIGE